MRRLAWDRYLVNYKGRPFLLSECHPHLRPDPTIVYYDIGVTPDELGAYACKHGFFPNEHGETEDARWVHAWECALALLSKKANFELDLRVPVSPDFSLAISVYSNIVFATNGLERKDMHKIVNAVLRELGFLGWTPPTEEELEQYKVAYREFCGISMEYDPVERIYRGVDCTDAAIPPAEE
ncbi:hypothetical protein BDW22DRAFT_1430906 [Trametopsis cervina]|nr:hypothetical protein BDW22DRAFT_1430906 [Trametopsis cervina]